MTLSLYTFFFEYDSGTYISQSRASDQHSALMNWAQELVVEEIAPTVWTKIAKSACEVSVANEYDITPVKGLVEVWCWTTVVADQLGILTIVRSS